MLKNTAFHDNLYQIAKIISITTEGLSLELSENMFLNKTVADISFISDTLQSLFVEVQNLSHLPDTETFETATQIGIKFTYLGKHRTLTFDKTKSYGCRIQ